MWGRLQKDSENIYIHSNVRTGFSEISLFLFFFTFFFFLTEFFFFFFFFFTSIPFQTEILFFSLFIFKCFIFKTDFNSSYINAMLMVTVIWFVFVHLLCIVMCASFFYLHVRRLVFIMVKSIEKA